MLIPFMKENHLVYTFLSLGLPIVLLILHSEITLTVKRAILFIFLATTIGWMAEVLGLKTGVIFGGHYVYGGNKISLWGVPIMVIAYWAVFIYVGYSIVNSFFYWRGNKKPNRKSNDLKRLPGLVLADGLVVMFIDIFMDPLKVLAGEWSWVGGGSFFGVPLGNFVGWFVVTVIVTGIYRLFEYFAIGLKNRYSKTIYLIPVICYSALAISFTLEAIENQIIGLAIIGNALMQPIVVANLSLFVKRKE